MLVSYLLPFLSHIRVLSQSWPADISIFSASCFVDLPLLCNVMRSDRSRACYSLGNKSPKKLSPSLLSSLHLTLPVSSRTTTSSIRQINGRIQRRIFTPLRLLKSISRTVSPMDILTIWMNATKNSSTRTMRKPEARVPAHRVLYQHQAYGLLLGAQRRKARSLSRPSLSSSRRMSSSL